MLQNNSGNKSIIEVYTYTIKYTMRNVAIYLVMRKSKLLLHANPWINCRHVKRKKAGHKRVYTTEKRFHFYDVQEQSKFACSDRNRMVVIFAEEYDWEETQDSF